MKLVGAGFHGVVEITAACASVFCRIVAGLNGYFLDGIGARLVDLCELPPKAVGRVLALDVNGLRTRWHPINPQRIIGGEMRPGKQFHGSQWVSNVPQPAGVSKSRRSAAQREQWKVD